MKLANGEYTAASVDSDEKDALKLGLVQEKDGNYGTAAPATSGAGQGSVLHELTRVLEAYVSNASSSSASSASGSTIS